MSIVSSRNTSMRLTSIYNLQGYRILRTSIYAFLNIIKARSRVLQTIRDVEHSR
jgi:hypothetical protein